MTKRQAIVFEAPNQVCFVEEPVEGPGPGEVLVETTRSLISTGTELTVLTQRFAPGTHWDQWVKYPFRPGYLNVGRVSAVGEAVEGWAVGDRVASRGRHASHVAVAMPHGGVRIPDGVSDEAAVWMGLGKITQVGVRAAEHRLGDVVAVVGLGLLGQLVVQYSKLMGASEVIAVDTAPMRLAMAAEHGATQTLRMTAAEALEPVRGLSGGAGADVVYDVTGHPAVLAQALPLARRHGKVILLGDPGSPQLQHLTSDVISRGVRIIGAHDGHPPRTPTEYVRWSTPQMCELFQTYLARGQMRTDDLVTHRFRPEDAAEAYALLERERETAMGVVFEWGD